MTRLMWKALALVPFATLAATAGDPPERPPYIPADVWELHRELMARAAVPVTDPGDMLVVRLQAPGFDPKDFTAQVKGGVLSVRAAREKAATTRKAGGVEAWSDAGTFRYEMTLPAGAADGPPVLEYKDGVLEVRVSKTAGAPARKQ